MGRADICPRSRHDIVGTARKVLTRERPGLGVLRKVGASLQPRGSPSHGERRGRVRPEHALSGARPMLLRSLDRRWLIPLALLAVSVLIYSTIRGATWTS